MPSWFSIIFKYQEKKSPDKLGLYPGAVHIKAFPERRYLWTSRLLVICSIFSFCLTIILSMTIYLLLPQRGALPNFIHKHSIESALEYLPNNEVSIQADRLLAEYIIGRYITLRHEIPKTYTQMLEQWQEGSEFHQLSSTKEYAIFSQRLDYATLSETIAKKISRSVTIDKVSYQANNLWVVHFTTNTEIPGQEKPVQGYWKAYVRIQYNKKETNYKELTSYNPLGIKIVKYHVGYRGSNAPTESTMESAKRNITDAQ